MTGHEARRLFEARGRARTLTAVTAMTLLSACAPSLPSELTLGEGLGAMFIFFVWVAALWIFVALFADIFRRPDLSGGAKAGWVLLLVVLPLLGSLIYIVTRPKISQPGRAVAAKQKEFSEDDAVAQLNRLKAAGKISDADYEEEMRQLRPG